MTKAAVEDGPSVEDLDDGLRYERMTIGKVTYVFQELDITEYGKMLERARGKGGIIDNVLLLKLMVLDCTRVMPAAPLDLEASACWEQAKKPSASFINTRPTHIARRINDVVNDMHYGDVESEEDRAAAEKAAADDTDDQETPEGEADASGPSPTSAAE